MSGILPLSEIRKLTVADRIRLVQDIWDSIAVDVERLPLTHAQRQEVDSRLAAHRANPGLAIAWELVEADAWARLRRSLD